MKDKDILTTISYVKNSEKHQIVCEGKGEYEGCYIGGYRYKLEIEISSDNNKPITENKTLACIMMNPSTTFPDNEWKSNWERNLNYLKYNKKPRKTTGFDPTIINVIKMAASKGYSKICIFNLFPYIHPTGKVAIEKYQCKKEKNKEIIRNWKKSGCDKVLVAWGSHLPEKAEKKSYIKLQEEYIRLFKKKNIKPVFYAWNENAGCPYHPSSQVDSCWTNRNGEIVKRKKNDGSLGIIQQFIDDEKDFTIWQGYPKNN